MRFHEQPVPQFIADDAVGFHKADWSDLPTMHHVVNAPAALPVLEARGSAVTLSRGGKSYRDQHVLL
jgi:hypothetical protein